MPPEDAGEKTEAPTPRRRQEARERGQVAMSQDMTAAISLLGAMLILNFAAPKILRSLVNLMTLMFSYDASDAVRAEAMPQWIMLAGKVIAGIVVPVTLGFMGVALLATIGQVGLLFTLHPLAPNLAKLNPISGLQKLFSTQALMRLFSSVFKVALISAVAYFTIKARIPMLVNVSELHYWALAALAGELMFMLGVRMAIVLLILAIIDYAYQKYRHEQTLKMTKQEIKEEMRRMEGDPLVAERRKRVARQLAMQRMQAAVPNADVVVTNPTHYAVALKYQAETMQAPKVVAKGADLVAQRIRELAATNGVPVVQRKPLAQALYRTVEVGQEIPPSFYKAVAEILAYVYELNGQAGANRPAAAAT